MVSRQMDESFWMTLIGMSSPPDMAQDLPHSASLSGTHSWHPPWCPKVGVKPGMPVVDSLTCLT